MTKGECAKSNLDGFKSAMQRAGIEPPKDILPDGKIHRFHVNDDRPGTQTGWYVLHGELSGIGSFGCWKRDIKAKYEGTPYSDLSPEQRDIHDKTVEKINQTIATERNAEHERCRKDSAKLWNISRPAIKNHGYLRKKGISPSGVRQDNQNKILIPVQDHDGVIHGLQTIASDGTKRFEPGTNKTGNFFRIGKLKNNTIVICEGFATAASIREATGHACITAFDAGNLLPVAQSFRSKCPDYKIIIAADNDAYGDKNIGVSKATEAAVATQSQLVIPTFKDTSKKPTDFNDLFQLEGTKAVKKQIEAARIPASSDPWHSQIFSLKDSFKPRPPLQYIVDGLFPLSSLSIIYGSPGCMKSFLLAYVALCVAAHISCLGRKVIQSPVLFVDLDNGIRRTTERFAALGRGHKISDAPCHFVSMPTPGLIAGNDKDIEALIERVIRLGCKFVVIDNLGLISGGADENTAQMILIMRNLRLLAERTGAAVVIVHHQRKGNGNNSRLGETLRGHSSIEASLDLALLVEREGSILKIRSTKSRDVEVLPFGADFTFHHKPGTQELLEAGFTSTEITDSSPGSVAKKSIIEVLQASSPLNQSAIVAKVKPGVKIGESRIIEILSEMVGAGTITSSKGKKNSTLYSLTRSPLSFSVSPSKRGGKLKTEKNTQSGSVSQKQSKKQKQTKKQDCSSLEDLM